MRLAECSSALGIQTTSVAIATVALYPLELWKTRLQTAEQVRTLPGCFIVAFWGAIYIQGILADLSVLVPRLLVENLLDKLLFSYVQSVPLASLIIGGIVGVIICPFESVKVYLQTSPAPPHCGIGSQANLYSTAIRKLGWHGLWRGLDATLVKTAATYCIFCTIASTSAALLPTSVIEGDAVAFLFHRTTVVVLAGIIAFTVTTPIDVAKTRLQMSTSEEYVSYEAGQGSLIGCLSAVNEREGSMALWVGVVPRALYGALYGVLIAFWCAFLHTARGTPATQML